MHDDIIVSVKVMTYNHAPFIRKALDSILKQKVNFAYEIVVGDDASTDGTQAILEEYHQKYPNKFVLLLNQTNSGSVNNACRINKKLHGRYIAFLEGDNYWTDENKLQMQFDFMETHPEYSACGHAHINVDESGSYYKLPYDTNCEFHQSFYGWKDFQMEKLPGHSNSLFFKNIYLNSKIGPDMVKKFSKNIGDETTVISLLLTGKIYFFNKRMLAWRIIVKDYGTNWCSRIRQNPYLNYDYFFYYVRIEDYLKKEWNKRIYFNRQKKRRMCLFIGSIETIKPYKINCLCKMAAYSHNFLYFARIAVEYSYYNFIKVTTPDYIVEFHKKAAFFHKRYKKIFEISNLDNMCHSIGGKPVFLFGAGAAGKNFVEKYYTKFNIKCFTDNCKEKQGRSYLGLLVRKPEEINQNSIVIITSPQFEEEIIDQLIKKGVDNIYSFAAMEWKLRRRTIARMMVLENKYQL